MTARRTTTSAQAAFDLFEMTRADWIANARRIARRLGQTGETVTADMIHAHWPIPKEYDGRVMGAVFRPKEWERIGDVKSARSECHHRRIGLFRLRAVHTQEQERLAA